MNLVLVGPPGAGKGTQAHRLAERLGLMHLATGDLIRAEIAADSPLGQEIRATVDSGGLVADDLVLALVRDRLATADAVAGVVFDGFPRTTGQAERLATMVSLDIVLFLDVDEDAVVSRSAGRRTDPETGRVYHLAFAPPPPDVAPRLVQREDDREEIVRARLATYAASTAPVLGWYEKRGLLARVDGSGTVEEVESAVAEALAKVAA
ncbi:adenylate kinase [bacterium]|nr:adenylate kinase [bacterium]